MRLIKAIKAFCKAWSDPDSANHYLLGPSQEAKCQPDKSSRQAHLHLLRLLQQSGRLIDFFKEDISCYSDAEVGAAARQIHADCSGCLEDYVTVRPLREEKEGAPFLVPAGYDPAHLKVVGKVKGEPPYTGVLIHKGWKVHKRSLPKETLDEAAVDILSPSVVEVD